MDVSAVSALFQFTPSNTYRSNTLTSFINPSWMSTQSNTLALYNSQNTRFRFHTLISPTLCSTKSDTHNSSDIETNKDSTFGPNSSSQDQKLVEPCAENAAASLNSSSLSGISAESRGLVFDLGLEGSWDRAEIGSPVVKRFLSDDEERWYMWYYGKNGVNPGSDSIGLAVSSNGIHWERGGGAVESNRDVGLVMNCSKDWWAFDTQSVRPSEVVVMSSSKVRNSSAAYWLYYTGYSSENADFPDSSSDFVLENSDNSFVFDDTEINVLKSLPGLAISQDGRHWARIEGEHHSGALFDVGSKKEWDSLFIAAPHVVFHSSGDLRMYYHSFDVEKGEFSIGLARSRDGFRWIKLGKIIGGGGGCAFDECGVMNPCVVKNQKNGNYMMVYEGVSGDGKRSIGMAVSPDGLKEWRRLHEEAIFEASDKGCWDDKSVGSPCLVQMDQEGDVWRLYYRGVGCDGRTGIGMAVSQADFTNLERLTGFSL